MDKARVFEAFKSSSFAQIADGGDGFGGRLRFNLPEGSRFDDGFDVAVEIETASSGLGGELGFDLGL